MDVTACSAGALHCYQGSWATVRGLCVRPERAMSEWRDNREKGRETGERVQHASTAPVRSARAALGGPSPALWAGGRRPIVGDEGARDLLRKNRAA